MGLNPHNRTLVIRILRTGEEIANPFAVGPTAGVHRLRQTHAPPQRRSHRPPAHRSGDELPQLRNPQAQGRRGLRGDADDPARQPGRNHRQRRPGRGRVPHRDAAAPPISTASSARCRCSPRAQAPARLTDQPQPLTERREQPRLPGPVRPHTGAITQPGFARMDINKHINGCGLVWINHTESAPSMGTKALHDNLAWTARSGLPHLARSSRGIGAETPVRRGRSRTRLSGLAVPSGRFMTMAGWVRTSSRAIAAR